MISYCLLWTNLASALNTRSIQPIRRQVINCGGPEYLGRRYNARRGVGRKLAPVHGEHLFADQAHLVADQEDFEEKSDRFPVLGGDEVGYRREVRPGVGGEGHKDDVFIAAVGDLAAGGYSLGVCIQDYLEQHPGDRRPGRRSQRSGSEGQILKGRSRCRSYNGGCVRRSRGESVFRS